MIFYYRPAKNRDLWNLRKKEEQEREEGRGGEGGKEKTTLIGLMSPQSKLAVITQNTLKKSCAILCT